MFLFRGKEAEGWGSLRSGPSALVTYMKVAYKTDEGKGANGENLPEK